MSPHTFSRFAYLDTNILSELAKRPDLWETVLSYLTNEDLTLAISDQLAELADAERLHESLSRMLVFLPSAIIKTGFDVLSEEVASHPRARSNSLLVYPVNALVLEPKGPTLFEEFLRSANLRAARASQREAASRLADRMAELERNFPVSRDGVYRKEQAPAFAFAVTVQWLVGTHHSFVQHFQTDITGFKVDVFRSLRLFAMVVYYKYYLGNRSPRKASDFGDLFHLYAIPYCSVAIVERDLADVLAQVKRHDRILDGTDVRNIGFIRQLCSPSKRFSRESE